MNPWILITLVGAGAVFGLDFLLRRKKWSDNTKGERISLLVNMLAVGPYLFLSALGLLWGIASSSPETALGETLYDVTLIMGQTFFIVAVVAAIASLILRKIGKVKASTWVNIIAIVYIVVVLTLNGLVGKFM